jgi:hypothetical protein
MTNRNSAREKITGLFILQPKFATIYKFNFELLLITQAQQINVVFGTPK